MTTTKIPGDDCPKCNKQMVRLDGLPETETSPGTEDSVWCKSCNLELEMDWDRILETDAENE